MQGSDAPPGRACLKFSSQPLLGAGGPAGPLLRDTHCLFSVHCFPSPSWYVCWFLIPPVGSAPVCYGPSRRTRADRLTHPVHNALTQHHSQCFQPISNLLPSSLNYARPQPVQNGIVVMLIHRKSTVQWMSACLFLLVLELAGMLSKTACRLWSPKFPTVCHALPYSTWDRLAPTKP